MQAGERQVSPELSGIRRDHVARYEFAAAAIARGSRIIDVACGIGYGSRLMAEAGHSVVGYDRDAEAIEYANRHYSHPVVGYVQLDANQVDATRFIAADAAVCFETIEHIEEPRPLLRALHAAAPVLYASVPNEAVMPWQIQPGVVTAFHYRHYTREQFEALLAECGWRVGSWFGQRGPESEVEYDNAGRTLIAVCHRNDAPATIEVTDRPVSMAVQASTTVIASQAPIDPSLKGKHIAIVGLGPSAAQYMSIVRGQGGRNRYCDEVWCINALGNVFACDRIFHMDDVRIQQIRAEAAPDSNIAAMLEWLRDHAGPIITSRAHPDYPGLVEFPLEAVINDNPFGYFNSTAAYAVAYAVFHRVGKLSLFGCDFTYPNAHDAEKGRACVEYWLGCATERGIPVVVPKTTSLLDACHTQAERFYGYDTLDIAIAREGGRIKVGFTERATLPTAEQIEDRYDHTRHPSPLVDAA